MGSRTFRLAIIFIISTLLDFMGERGELVKKVFPELSRRCRSRFVELLEVDLRSGIMTPELNSRFPKPGGWLFIPS
jgi:hypothetical protein